MKANTFWTIIALAMMGVNSLGLVLHEGIHIAQAKNPTSVCLDIGQSTIAHVEATDFKANTEWWAYGIETVFILTGCIWLFVIGRRETR